MGVGRVQRPEQQLEMGLIATVSALHKSESPDIYYRRYSTYFVELCRETANSQLEVPAISWRGELLSE
jgi:hypothetical protein